MRSAGVRCSFAPCSLRIESVKLASLKDQLAAYTVLRASEENQNPINWTTYSGVMNIYQKLSDDIWAIEDKIECAPPGFDHTTVFYSQPTGQDLSYRKTMRIAMVKHVMIYPHAQRILVLTRHMFANQDI